MGSTVQGVSIFWMTIMRIYRKCFSEPYGFVSFQNSVAPSFKNAANFRFKGKASTFLKNGAL